MLMGRYDPILMRETGKVFRCTLFFHALEQKPKDKIQSVDYGCGTKTLLTRHLASGK